jgi:hypothetical protein
MGIEIRMSGTPRSTENRQVKRYRYRGQAILRRLDEGESLPARILNLSLRGCLLRLPDLSDFAVGALVDLGVSTSLATFRALGSIRHCSHRRRLLGISFVNLTRRGEAELLDLIADLEAAEQAGNSGVHQITIYKYDRPPSNPPEE